MPTVVNPDPWLPSDTSLPGIPAVRAQVYHYDDSDPVDPEFIPLPNVQLMGIKKAEGPNPGVATFRYDLTTGLEGAPSTLEQALDKSFTGPLTVDPGWRLSVQVTRPDGVNFWLFDGIVLDFGGQLSGKHEEVTLAAAAYPKMLWNEPLPGRLERDSSNPTGTDIEFQTDRIAHPNARGKPNCTPEGYDTPGPATDGTHDYRFPAFLDEAVVQKKIKEDEDIGDEDFTVASCTWTLHRLARHILFNFVDTSICKVPTGDVLDALFRAKVPVVDGILDVHDPDTYTLKDLAVSDRIFTGYAWPGYLYDQMHPHGFGMRYDLKADENGFPEWTFVPFYKLAQPVKSLYLQPRGTLVNPWASNLEHLTVGRDLHDCVNQWHVVGGLTRYEVTLVLGPLFPMSSSDLTRLTDFLTNSPNFLTSDNADRYRLFGFDETGEGHYTNGSTTTITDAGDLSPVLGSPDPEDEEEKPKFGQHRRVAFKDLLTKDSKGRPLKALLEASPDYVDSHPVCWDHQNDLDTTWYPIKQEWALLDDRLGIRITATDPNQWKIRPKSVKPRVGAGADPWHGGIIKVVQSLAAPNARNPAFVLRLTCVIEGDKAADFVARLSANSALPYAVTKQIDCRDRYRKEIVAECSVWNDTGFEEISRDDTDLMEAEATGYQINTQAGVMDAGPVALPYITDYYQIGDQIAGLTGRAFSFRTDNGGEFWQPALPVVTGIEWQFGAYQRTILTLSDRGLDRHGRMTLKGQAKAMAGLAHTSQRLYGQRKGGGGFLSPLPSAAGITQTGGDVYVGAPAPPFGTTTSGAIGGDVYQGGPAMPFGASGGTSGGDQYQGAPAPAMPAPAGAMGGDQYQGGPAQQAPAATPEPAPAALPDVSQSEPAPASGLGGGVGGAGGTELFFGD